MDQCSLTLCSYIQANIQVSLFLPRREKLCTRQTTWNLEIECTEPTVV